MILVVAVVAIVAVNRLQDMQSQVVDLFQQTTGRTVTFENLEGNWTGLNPQLIATGVEVRPTQSDHPNTARPLRFNRLQVELALPDLLLGRLVPKVLKINAPVLHLHLDSNNNIVIDELVLGAGEGKIDYTRLSRLVGMRLVVEGSQLLWHSPNGDIFSIDADLSMQTRNGITQVSGNFRAAGGQASLQLSLRGLAAGKPQANCNVRTQQLHWKMLPMQLRNLAPRLNAGKFSGNFKCYWAQGQLQQITGRSLLEAITVDLAPGSLALDSVRSSIQWNRQKNSWHAKLLDTQLQRDRNSFAVAKMSIRQLPANQYQLDIPNAQLPKALALWRRAITGTTDPLALLTAVDGQITSLQAHLTPAASGMQITSLQASCKQCAVKLKDPVRQIPAFDGQLLWTPAAGSATLETMTGNILWPTLWKKPVVLQRGQGQAEWQTAANGWNVNLKAFSAILPGLEVAANASLELDHKMQPGKIQLTLQHARGDIGTVRDLLPLNLPKKIHRWCINALLGGKFRLDQGVIKGDLQAENFLDKGSITLGAVIESGQLRLVPKWPVFENVSGHLDVSNRQLRFTVDQADFVKHQITGLEGSLEGLGTDHDLLKLTGHASGEIASLLTFLQKQQLDQGTTKTWLQSAAGIGELDLDLQYLLGGEHAAKFSGVYHFQNQRLTLLSGLQLSDIQGKLVLDNSHVAATGLTATAFSGPVGTDLFYTFKPGIREIKANGEADVTALLQFAGDRYTDLATGRLRWQGNWQNKTKKNIFTLQSTLKGVALNLPPPLQKDSITEWPLTVKILQQDQKLELLLDAGKALQTDLQYRKNSKDNSLALQTANIAVGTELLEKNKKPGLQATVIADHFNLDTWQQLLARYRNPDSPALPILKISLSTPDLYALSRPLGAIDLSIKPGQPQTLQLTVSGGRFQGRGHYKKADGNHNASLNLQMQHFYWPAAKQTSSSSGSDPDSWPDLKFHVDDFRYGDMQLGQLNLETTSSPGLLQINSLQLLRNDLLMQVDGNWKTGPNHGKTVFNFQAGSINLGSVVDSLGFKKQLQAGVADIQGQLWWPGRPADYKVSLLNGNLLFHAREGNILGVKPGSGRFLGLLNADALLQRLRLDFSDLTGEGLSYNEMEARAKMSSGNLLMDKLIIGSTVALVDLNGRIGLGAEDYDLKMTVAPQLGGNVSLISAVLNPVAGVAIYLLNKIFKDQINQWLRYEYLISGDWKKPQIKRIVLQANQKEPTDFGGNR